MISSNNNSNSFPLSFSKENDKLLVSDLRGGEKLKNKCLELGIFPGKTIEVINRSNNGPFVVMINNSRVILGHGTVNKIYVQLT